MDDDKLIQKYLNNSLNKKEQEDFIERLKEKPFSDELAFQQGVKNLSRKVGDENLNKLLEQEGSKIEAKKRLKIFLIALLVLSIILALIFGLMPRKEKINSAQQFALHYEKFPNVIFPKDRSIVEANPLVNAMQAYDDNDYRLTVNILDTTIFQNKDMLIYHALSNVAIGNDEKAIDQFLLIQKDRQSDFQNAGDWYLCLTYLKVDDKTSFETCMKRIASDKSHEFYQNANIIQNGDSFNR